MQELTAALTIASNNLATTCALEARGEKGEEGDFFLCPPLVKTGIEPPEAGKLESSVQAHNLQSEFSCYLRAYQIDGITRLTGLLLPPLSIDEIFGWGSVTAQGREVT